MKCSFKLSSYDISETPSDGRAKNVDVQIYSVKKDAYDSNGSPEYPLQRSSIFPYSSSVISTLATVTEKDGPDPLSPIVSFQEPLKNPENQQFDGRNPEKGMITAFLIKNQRYNYFLPSYISKNILLYFRYAIFPSRKGRRQK